MHHAVHVLDASVTRVSVLTDKRGVIIELARVGIGADMSKQTSSLAKF